MALLHQGVQCLQSFLDRCGRVKTVDLVQVNIIRLQARQARLAFAHYMAAGSTTGIGASPHGAKHLGRQHHIFAANAEILQGLADDALTGAETIDVGGIDKVDPRLQGDLHEFVGLFLLQLADQAPDVLIAAEGHGAQAQFGYEQPRVAQRLVAWTIVSIEQW